MLCKSAAGKVKKTLHIPLYGVYCCANHLAPPYPRYHFFCLNGRANWVVQQELHHTLCRRLHLTLSKNHVRDWVGSRRRMRREFSPGREDIHYHFSGNVIGLRQREKKNEISLRRFQLFRSAARISTTFRHRISQDGAADHYHK